MMPNPFRLTGNQQAGRIAEDFGYCRPCPAQRHPASRRTQNARQVAPPVGHALNPHHLTDDPEENGIASDIGDARLVANVGTELVDPRLAFDLLEFCTDILYECDGTLWIVLGDIGSNVVQIALDEVRELQPHHFAVPAASAIA